MKKIILVACAMASASMLSACEIIFPPDHHHDRDRYDYRHDHDNSSHHRDRDDDGRYRHDDDHDDDDFCPPGQAKKGRC